MRYLLLKSCDHDICWPSERIFHEKTWVSDKYINSCMYCNNLNISRHISSMHSSISNLVMSLVMSHMINKIENCGDLLFLSCYVLLNMEFVKIFMVFMGLELFQHHSSPCGFLLWNWAGFLQIPGIGITELMEHSHRGLTGDKTGTRHTVLGHSFYRVPAEIANKNSQTEVNGYSFRGSNSEVFFFCLPFQKVPTLQEKNLLTNEKILSFKSGPFLNKTLLTEKAVSDHKTAVSL